MIKYSLIALLFSLLLGTHTPGVAGDAVSDDAATPYIPKAQRRYSDEQGCVEPTADMRANHMKYLLHQRDATMHEGIRTEQHALHECINCHVSDAADAPHVDSDKHFCNSCHTYAAVTIDCFQCHADRPVKTPFESRLEEGDQADETDANPTAAPEPEQVRANEGSGNE
jgi:[DsrC]-trisulfide reductase subunit J